jgi:DNA-binding CsgD family transcriptional regulator
LGDQRDRIIGLIYEGVDDSAAWNVALSEVARLANAAGVGLGAQDMRTHAFRDLGAHGVDPSLHETYRRLAPDNRVWQAIGRQRRPMTDRMAMPRAEFERSELFADWFVPQSFCSVMAHPTLFDRSASSVLVAFRAPSQGDCEPADLATLGGMADHFGRALRMRLDRDRAQAEYAAVHAMLDEIPEAVLLVDRAARLRHANAAGRRLLSSGGGVRLRHGRLAVRDANAEARLIQTLSEGRAAEIRLPSADGAGGIVKVHPRGAGLGDSDGALTVVRIVDPNLGREPLTAARLVERLNLSLRQAEVVVALAAGRSEAEAAVALDLSQPTVHTHLSRVYGRLHLRNRAELVALLARNGFETGERSGKK